MNDNYEDEEDLSYLIDCDEDDDMDNLAKLKERSEVGYMALIYGKVTPIKPASKNNYEQMSHDELMASIFGEKEE